LIKLPFSFLEHHREVSRLTVRSICGRLGIQQKVNGKDAFLSWLRSQIKSRLSEKPTEVESIIQVDFLVSAVQQVLPNDIVAKDFWSQTVEAAVCYLDSAATVVEIDWLSTATILPNHVVPRNFGRVVVDVIISHRYYNLVYLDASNSQAMPLISV
jgi:hypothetical protein